MLNQPCGAGDNLNKCAPDEHVRYTYGWDAFRLLQGASKRYWTLSVQMYVIVFIREISICLHLYDLFWLLVYINKLITISGFKKKDKRSKSLFSIVYLFPEHQLNNKLISMDLMIFSPFIYLMTSSHWFLALNQTAYLTSLNVQFMFYMYSLYLYYI